MSKANYQSLIRAILTVLGTYLAGRNFFGHLLDPSLLAGISGTVLALGMVAWGYIDKETTIEGFESLIRSAGVAAGGVAVSLGWIKNEVVLELLGIGSILGPIILSKISRFKTKQVANGQAVADSTGKLQKAGPKISIVLLLICAATMAHGQSITQPIPKADTALESPFNHIIKVNAAGDSIYQGFRFAGPFVLYALPNSAIFTGVGISYEHDTYKSSNKKYYSDWAVTLGGYVGGQYAPTTWQAVTAAGLSVSFFNKLVTVGVLYNFMGHQVQVGTGPGVSLNN